MLDVALPAKPLPARGTRQTRLHELDILRFAAALSVLLYHYTFSGRGAGLSDVAAPALDPVTRYGYLGVDLFLLISGFVVLHSAWNRQPHEFLISRVVRLYPAYWVAVTVTAVACLVWGDHRFAVTAVQYLANLTMFQPLANQPNVDVVYWTLWVELRFYFVIWAMILIGTTRSRVIGLLCGWLAATAVIEAHVLPTGLESAADLLVQAEWSHYFIAGMALSLMYRFGRSRLLTGIVLAALANALYQAAGFAHRVGERYHTQFRTGVVLGVIAGIFVVMSLVALRVTGRLGRPWFAIAGALTYPLYLLHAYLGFLVFDRLSGTAPAPVLLVCVAIGAIAAAYLVHRFVERPLAPLLRRLLQGAAARASQLRAARPREPLANR